MEKPFQGIKVVPQYKGVDDELFVFVCCNENDQSVTLIWLFSFIRKKFNYLPDLALADFICLNGAVGRD